MTVRYITNIKNIFLLLKRPVAEPNPQKTTISRTPLPPGQLVKPRKPIGLRRAVPM